MNNRDKDDFGKLAHNFNCKKADNNCFKPLADEREEQTMNLWSFKVLT